MGKIGIFGGSFNPIHSGHINMAKNFADALQLDSVVFVPASVPPHKNAANLAAPEHRLAMCRLACQSDPRFSVSSIELDRLGKSYTVDTVSQLASENDELYLLMGSDMFLSFETWKNYRKIAGFCTVCGCARDKKDHDAIAAYAKKLKAKKIKTRVVEMKILPVSSTYIRNNIDDADALEKVPAKVRSYIKKCFLYEIFVKKYELLAKSMLSPKRFYHSVNVAALAVKLSERYGESPEKAKIAGILHDIFKETSEEELLQLMEKFGIILSENQKKVPKVWHGIVCAAYMEKELRIKDRDLCNAVKFHSTGRAGMSMLEKIIYAADLTSRERSYEGVEGLRSRAFTDIDAAVLAGCEFEIAKNKDKDFLCEDTQKARDYLLKQKRP